MSLFENDAYRWRETYFILMKSEHRPSCDAVRQCLADLSGHLEIQELVGTEDGAFETVTLIAPEHLSAMDISYIGGDDLVEQSEDLLGEITRSILHDDDRARLDAMSDCDARLDIYHFELVSSEDDMMDPSALLMVVERLSAQCQGLGVDPQSGAII